MRRVILLVVLVVFSFNAFAAADSLYAKRSYTPAEIQSNPPIIDGTFDDAIWEHATWADDFIQHEPYDGKQPSQETEFKILYDANYLYVAIRAYDTSPDSIVKRMTRRDDIDGDIVAIQFDSYHDLRTGFTFFVGVGGTKGDMIMSNDGGNEDETWDPVWWAKTSVDNEGWNAEIKIPFSQLRFDKNGDDTWGLQVARVIYRYDETSIWQPIRRDAPGWVHLIGNMTGMKGISPRKQTEITPYFVGGLENYEPEEGNPYAPGQGFLGNAGIDAKIGLTNNLMLDLTLNPDFGQVEADPSEVNLTAYETYFSEKRPFFIEGKSIFSYPIMFGDGDLGSESMFYSRRIGHRPYYSPELTDNEYIDQPEFTRILGSAKISGKTKDGLSVGVLESVTASEYANISLEGNERAVKVEPLTNYFVSRVSKDFNKGNSILGGIITSTNRQINDTELDFLPTGALTGGLDYTQYFAEKKYMLKAVSYFSNVRGSNEAIYDLQTSSARYYQRPDADYLKLDSSRNTLSGYGGNFQLLKISGSLNLMAAVAWKSPGLELNDIGFMRSADEIIEVLWAGYRFYEPFSIFRSASLNLNQWRALDFGGRVLEDGGNINGHASFKNYWSSYFSVNFTGNQRNNGLLRGGSSIYVPADYGFSFGFSSDSRKKFVFEADLDLYGGVEKQVDLRNYSVELQYKPASFISLEIEPDYRTRIRDLQFITINENDVENRYIFGSIDQRMLSLSVRINLTITPELTVQYWGQPFIASGDYTDFKVITDPLADEYHDRFRVFTESEINYLPDDELYLINESRGDIPAYYIDNPDFSFKEFLSNLVVRWEYKPGSTLYLVWSQNRQEAEISDLFDVLGDSRTMFNIYPYNTFLVKFSYRIGN